MIINKAYLSDVEIEAYLRVSQNCSFPYRDPGALIAQRVWGTEVPPQGPGAEP